MLYKVIYLLLLFLCLNLIQNVNRFDLYYFLHTYENIYLFINRIMKKFTLIIDAFGQSPQFLIKRKNYYHSVFGGIITIILYGISVISLIFFSQELFLKRAPSVNLSTESDEHPEKIQYYGNYDFLLG